ncbi:outer membrane beta-barrel protein [Flavihumibacter sp. R14]|nr:outer membrane beta-barrel protein [Flavihumibacter soli]
MNKTLLFLILTFLSFSAAAQSGRQVIGSVADSAGNKISAASVRLVSAKDTLASSTNDKGAFTFSNVKASDFTITITRLGFEIFSRSYKFGNGNIPLTLDPITLKFESQLLNEVVISGTPKVTIKEDTVEYKASDYKLRENALAEDLLKKLPGVEVDKDGNVKAQGKAITKIRVNGKDFFGGDVKTATQQLPADMISKIQIVDDYGDQANLTGIKNGDPEKVLNIEISPDKNKGYMTRGTLGGGNKERYQASLTANSFKDKQQLSFLGNLNNTNSSVFNFNGGGGGGIRIQGGGGGGGMRMGGNTNNAGGDGITLVGSIGLNYRDDWSKKLTSYGSYSFSNRDNELLSNQQTLSTFKNSMILNDQNNSNSTQSTNHRLNWNLEYRPDSLNYIKFSPSFSYSMSDAQGFSDYNQLDNGEPNSVGITSSNSASEVPNIGGNLLLNHRFAKRGRNVSLNLSVNSGQTDQQREELNDYTNYREEGNTDVYLRQNLDIINRSVNTGATLSYNEPLTRTSNLEFTYNFNYTKYKNERETFDVDQLESETRNDALSNNYDYSFATNRLGVNYRVNQKKYNYSIGASLQPSVLEGNSVINNTFNSYRNTGLNFVPTARFSYNFSRTRAFNASYFGRSTEPEYTQLQPIPDISNPQYTIYGNPNLNAEFSHRLNLRYNNFEFNTGNVLFTNVSFAFTEDKIVNDITVLENVPTVGRVQETRYRNTDGYYTANGFYTYSKPFADRKYVVSINGSANFNNNVSFVEGEKSIGKNWILTQGLNTQINPVKWLEMNPGFTYSYNTNSNDIITNSNTKVSTYGINFNSKTYFLKTFLIGVDLSKTVNSGYSSLLASNPFIINTYLEKQFFKDKKGTLRLQAFDLLDENTSVSRNVIGNSTIDSRSNRLSRYFMLSFTMRLQKFNGKETPMQMPGRGERFEMRREGGF